MLSILEVKKLLGDNAKRHFDEELLQTRDDLYSLAELCLECYYEKQISKRHKKCSP